MIDTTISVFAIAAALGSGLVAGIFFAFSNFVMSALGRVAPDAGIAAMQAINRTVLNPLFLAAFFGTGAICLALAAAALFRWNGPGSGFALAGSLAYLLGSVGVTMIGNVPLNKALAAVGPGSAEAVPVWSRYLGDWTRWNHVRTVASLVASAAFVLAVV